ncbi:transcription factor [Rhodotorula toruloides]|uniref:Transcription factor n=1 Tax=Rhodotorula toruloides TaxID=5286 RepID=A0A511KKB9_RHOTO|nr:transcription factor [Rhodotorula toruloides]
MTTLDPPIDPVLLALSKPRAGQVARRRSRSASARKSSLGDVQVGEGDDDSMDELGRDDEPYQDSGSDVDAEGDIFIEDGADIATTTTNRKGAKKKKKASLSAGEKGNGLSKQAKRLKAAMGPKGADKPHIGRKGPAGTQTSCENCRSRKIKCSRHANCTSCQIRGETCVWRAEPPIKTAEWASTQAVINANHAERDRLRRIIQALSIRYSARELSAALREGRDPREPPTLVDVPLHSKARQQGGRKKASPLDGAAGLLALALHGFDGTVVNDVQVDGDYQMPVPPDQRVNSCPFKLPEPPLPDQHAPANELLDVLSAAATSAAGPTAPPISTSNIKPSCQPPLRVTIPSDPSSGPPTLASTLPFALPPPSSSGHMRAGTGGAQTRPASPSADDRPALRPLPYPSYPTFLSHSPRPVPPPLSTVHSRAPPPPTFFYPLLPSPLMSPRSITSLAHTRHAAMVTQRDPRLRLMRRVGHEDRFDRAMAVEVQRASVEKRERDKREAKGKQKKNALYGIGGDGEKEQNHLAANGVSPASSDHQQRQLAQQAALAWAASNGIAPASTNITSQSTDPPAASSSPSSSSAAAYAAVQPYRPLARDLDPPLVDPGQRRRSSWLVSPVSGSTTGGFALLTTGRPVLSVDAAGATASAAGSSLSALFRTPSALTSASSGGLFGRISLSPMRSDEGEGDERFEPRIEGADEWARFEPRQANEGEREVAAQAAARTVVEEEDEEAQDQGMETEDGKSSVGVKSGRSAKGDDEAGSGESDGDE